MKPKLRATTYAYVVEVERLIGTYKVAVRVHVFDRKVSVASYWLSGPFLNFFELIFCAKLPEGVRKEAEEKVLTEWKAEKLK